LARGAALVYRREKFYGSGAKIYRFADVAFFKVGVLLPKTAQILSFFIKSGDVRRSGALPTPIIPEFGGNFNRFLPNDESAKK